MKTRVRNCRFFFFLLVLLLAMATVSCTMDFPEDEDDDEHAAATPISEESVNSIDRSLFLSDDGQEDASSSPTPSEDAVLPIGTQVPTQTPTLTPTPVPTNTPTPEPTPTDVPTRNYGPGQLSYSRQDAKVFYVVNTSSSKFHYTTCGRGPTKNIAYTTDEYFEDSGAARAWLTSHGYEPCKVCYP